MSSIYPCPRCGMLPEQFYVRNAYRCPKTSPCSANQGWMSLHDWNARMPERVTDAAYTKEVADAVLKKVMELDFKVGRDHLEAFETNNLPTYITNDTVTLMRSDLIKFHNDFAMMTAFLAHLFKTEHIAPIHLLGLLREHIERGS